MSGGNSWTILTSEETVAETLKPLSGAADHHEESHTSAADSGETAQPANGAESAEALHVDDYLVSEEKPAELNGDDVNQHAAVTDSPVTSCFEVSASLVHCDEDEVDHTQVLSEDQPQFSPDPDSFSDSYTHVTPSPDEPAASPPSAETLGSAEFSQEEEKLSLEATLHPLNGENLHRDEEESDCYLRTTDLGKQADLEVAGEKTAEEEEPEVRKRRSLLAALEQIGQREEEEVEEEFQLPQREDDSGFSVNKCILGAVILLGLGTIFFSDSDYNTRELKEAVAAGKQEWLNPDVPPDPIHADSSELLNKLAEGNEQISVLQAQLQAQKDELKVAMGQAAEGVKERLRWEEVEKENTPHTEPDPVKPAASPPGGQPEDSTSETAGSEGRQDRKQWDERKEKKKDLKRDKHDMGEMKDWKERDKSVRKEGEKREHKDGGKTDRKKVIHEFDKEKEREGKQRKRSEETKHWKEKDWKKEKDGRGDEGKPWKNRDGKKEWREKSENKEWKEEKDRKKVKSEKVNEGKQWRGKGEDKDWKSGEKQKSKEEWKKTKDGFKEGRKEWKEREKEWKNKNDKDQGRGGKGRGERKQWEGSTERPSKEERKHLKEQEWKSKNGKHDKEWKKKEQRFEEEDWKRGGQKEKKHNGDGTKDKWKKNRVADDRSHKEGHLYGERKQSHSHRKPSVGQPEYWVQQKDRLHHDPTPPRQCDSVETCAQQERLRPVPFAEFDAILQSYLTKAEEAGVDKSKMEELQKLTPDFFQDGVFVHDKISFQDFVEDVGDILEDMVEVDDSDDEEESAIEEEMEGFEREVMKTFLVAGDKEKRVKGEWRKESVPGRG